MAIFTRYEAPRYRTARRIIEGGLLAVTILLAILGWIRVVPSLIAVPIQQDFGAYYVAASLVNQDLPLYQWEAPPPDARLAQIPQTGYLYPPFFAALLRPLAQLSHPTAIRVWLGLNVLAFAAMMAMLVHLFRVPRWLIAPLVGLCLLLPAVYDTWLLGQISVMLTLLFVLILALSVAPTPRPWHAYAAGILLGIAIVIKLYPVYLGLIYLAHRQVRTILATIGTVIGAFLFGILLGGGWQNTEAWFTKVLPAVSIMSPHPLNQSLRAGMARFFTSNEFQVPVLNKDNYLTIKQPALIESPTLGTVMTVILSLLVFALTMRAIWTPVKSGAAGTFVLDFALGIMLILLLTPVVWDFYFVHLLIPLLVLGRVAQCSPRYRLLLLAGMLFIAIQRYWRYLLLYSSSPLIMVWGMSGVILIWLALLRLRTHPLPPGPGEDKLNAGDRVWPQT